MRFEDEARACNTRWVFDGVRRRPANPQLSAAAGTLQAGHGSVEDHDERVGLDSDSESDSTNNDDDDDSDFSG